MSTALPHIDKYCERPFNENMFSFSLNSVCLHHMAVIPPTTSAGTFSGQQMAAYCLTLLCALALL